MYDSWSLAVVGLRRRSSSNYPNTRDGSQDPKKWNLMVCSAFKKIDNPNKNYI